jgi:hypothetical protein
MYQMESNPCAETMPDRLSVRANISAPTSAMPIATSYDTICALERKPPSKAYFELEDQPASISASTPTDDTESTNSKPMLMSVMTPQSGANGITTKTTKAATTEMKGAKKKMYVSA